MDKFAEIRVPISHKNPSIRRKENKCVLCGKCKDVCKKQMGVAGFWKYDSESIVCINCGQCANFCPVEAIVEQDNCNELITLIDNPNKKVAVIVAPAVRVSLGEMFGLPVGEFVAGKMVSALKQLGADYVFDVSFGADMTVMEEAYEFLSRLKQNKDLPHLTSCCPAWVNFAKTFYPQYVPNLSTCKSPIAMLSNTIKNWFARQQNIKPEDLAVVAITPCVAKKAEANLLSLRGEYGKDTDCVVTVRELGRALKDKSIDFSSLPESSFDKPFDVASGAGVMFGASTGVTQAVMRTAYYLETGKELTNDMLQFKPVPKLPGAKQALLDLNGRQIKLCAIAGTMNVRNLLKNINKFDFDFVEIMACPNGCVGGGGQPRQENNIKAVSVRGVNLFNFDATSSINSSYQNEQLNLIYKEFFIKPNSKKANEYLHVNHSAR